MQCSIVGVGGRKDVAPLPLFLPLTNNKVQSSKESNLKMVNTGLRDLSWSETCGQILARAILELGCHPSLFSVGNKVHVLEAVSLTFYPVIQIFPNNLRHLYTQETLKEKDAGLQLFFLPFVNE